MRKEEAAPGCSPGKTAASAHSPKNRRAWSGEVPGYRHRREWMRLLLKKDREQGRIRQRIIKFSVHLGNLVKDFRHRGKGWGVSALLAGFVSHRQTSWKNTELLDG